MWEIVLELMTLHFVTFLVDVLTQTSLAHLPPSLCFLLLPFYVFLGTLLLFFESINVVNLV